MSHIFSRCCTFVTVLYGVVGTLHHRAQQICSSPELLQQEEKHLHQALKNCKYPKWALNKAKLRSKAKKKRTMGTNTTSNNNTKAQSPTWWYPITRGSVRALKRPVINMVYRCTSKEVEPSKAS